MGTTAQASTQTFMLSINPKDKRATKLIEALKLMDFITIEKSPYDPAFVAKIERSKKSKKHFVELSKLWD